MADGQLAANNTVTYATPKHSSLMKNTKITHVLKPILLAHIGKID